MLVSRVASLAILLTVGSPLALAGPWPGAHDDTPQILAVGEAFQPQPAEWHDGRLSLRLDIAPGCYLYRDKLKVEVLEPAGYTLGKQTLAEGSAFRDEHFGEVRIFRGALETQWQAKTPPRKLKVSYQGCAEGLVCYPMQTRVVDVFTLP